MTRGGRPAQRDDRRDQKGRTEIVSTTRSMTQRMVWRHLRMVDVCHFVTIRVEDTEPQSGLEECGVPQKKLVKMTGFRLFPDLRRGYGG